MMKKIFTMAALAFLMTACSNDIDEPQAQQQPANSDGMITITAKLAPKSEAGTRAVAPGTDSNGKDIIKVKWAVDEHLAILYEVNSTKYEADARISYVDANTGIATIEFSVQSGTADDTPCTIVYPKSAAKDDHSGVKDAATLLAAQDGTLKDDLDVRVGAGTIIATTPNLIVTTQPAAQFAIHKFTIQDLSAADKTATEFKVSDASGNVIATVTPVSATGTLYVALPVMAAGTYWFKATVGGNPYIAKATVATATTAGNYYQTTVKLATVGNIIGADGKFYANKTAVDAAATTGAAMIVYLGSDGETNATYNHGLAIALTDASTDAKWGTYNADAGLTKYTHWCQGDDDASTDMTGIANTAALKTLYNGNTDYEAANAVSGYSVAGFTPGDHGFSGWFLPSAGQWYKFLTGMCGLAWTGGWGRATGTGSDNFNTVNAKFTAAGYDTDDAKFENVDWYWSSSEYSLGNAVDVNFDSDYGVLVGHNGKVGHDRVRCFLAF